MSDKFNAYEYIGVIAPGSVIMFGATMVYPDLKALISGDGVTIGGLGIFIILAYIVGHLLQGFGNFFENIFWSCFGGLPTQWVLKPKKQFLASVQVSKLFEAVRKLYPEFNPVTVSSRDWFFITREMYSRVRAADLSERIDIFNQSYGLLRGIGVALIFATALSAFLHPLEWEAYTLIAGAAALAIYRMYRFGTYYGRELFIAFLKMSNP
jgi:hypothetical protein